MQLRRPYWLCIVLPLILTAQGDEFQRPLDNEPQNVNRKRKWDFDWPFSGITTFGHLDHVKCLVEFDEVYDIAVIGAPFDSAVTYRPGARLGPRAIRQASSRHLPARSFHSGAGINPYRSWAKIIDCGDIPITPIDNNLAQQQMTEAFIELGSREPAAESHFQYPRLLILGGDHSVSLPALRALHTIYKTPMTVLHFDAHLDTLHPSSYPYSWASTVSDFNHGSMFWKASAEGLVANGSSVHAGIRTRLNGDDYSAFEEDDRQGYMRIFTDDIDTVGTGGIVTMIHERIGPEVPVYLSIDIDVLDPAFAPGTGAPESGGWTSRELIKILSGLRDLNVVGADIVEVAPAYDSLGGDTAFTAATLGFEIVTSWALKGERLASGSKFAASDHSYAGNLHQTHLFGTEYISV